MNINILIDYTQIPIYKAGVGVYAFNLVMNIKSNENLHYFLLIQDDDTCFDGRVLGKITLIKVNSKKYRKLWHRLFLEQIYIPYLVYKYNIDIVHSLHYSFPIFTRAKKVVTVCDMIFYKYPEYHLKSKVLYFQFFIWLTTFFADKVVCISKSTQKDYTDRFKVSSKLTTVIELGKDEIFKNNIDLCEIKKVLNKYSIDSEYILFIGTIEPRKNVDKLIIAFSKLPKELNSLRLVIVGKKGWHYESVFSLIKQLKLEDKVVFTGFVLESEKPALLAGARVFAYPSFYEGFGIPVLESMACGTPTITSNISSMPEVAGAGALLINPFDVNEINYALVKLLTDLKYSDELREKGLCQASKFTWEATAKKTISMYKSVSLK